MDFPSQSKNRRGALESELPVGVNVSVCVGPGYKLLTFSGYLTACIRLQRVFFSFSGSKKMQATHQPQCYHYVGAEGDLPQRAAL